MSTATSTNAFLDSVNAICEKVSLAEMDSQMAHEMFFYECAREQIKKHNPKAHSYGLVHQLIDTDPRKWGLFPSA